MKLLRMRRFKKHFSKTAASERSRRTCFVYVETLNDARTPLKGFFNIR